MNEHTFDHFTRAMRQPASRRAIVGGIAATALGGSLFRAASASPSARAACMKAATAAAKTCRKGASTLKGKEKAAALKACQESFQAARVKCVSQPGGDTDGADG